MKLLPFLAAAALTFPIPNAFGGDGPTYSLNLSESHPYRFLPGYGHAWQNPGSPRYFVPGYGYQIPGFGTAGRRFDSLNDHERLYSNGNRRVLPLSPRGLRYETNSTAGPWYHPGWPGNTQFRSFAW